MHPTRVSELLLYRLSVVTRSTSLPLVRIFEGEFGITRHHWHMLALLVEHGAMQPSQLAALSWLDRPRVSRGLAGLIDKGLATRASDGGRVHRVQATAAGLDLYDKAMKRVAAFNAQLASVLSAKERSDFDQMLARLQSRALSLADEVARASPPAPRNRRRA